MPRGEHHTKNTETVTRWCPKQGRETRWRCSNGHPVECEECNLNARIAAHADRKRRTHVPTIYEEHAAVAAPRAASAADETAQGAPPSAPPGSEHEPGAAPCKAE